MRLRTSNCSLLLIYRPRKDERVSWPGWLTYSGRFTHISGHCARFLTRRSTRDDVVSTSRTQATKQEFSYCEQMAHPLRTQYVEGI